MFYLAWRLGQIYKDVKGKAGDEENEPVAWKDVLAAATRAVTGDIRSEGGENYECLVRKQAPNEERRIRCIVT
jgi:hypothetical protein